MHHITAYLHSISNILKGTYYAPLQDVIKTSGVPRMCLWNFCSKYPTGHLLSHFENACFEWKQKRCVFVHVSSNAKELLYLRYSARKHLFGFESWKPNTESVLKPYRFKLLVIRFSECAYPKHVHRKLPLHGMWELCHYVTAASPLLIWLKQ